MISCTLGESPPRSMLPLQRRPASRCLRFDMCSPRAPPRSRRRRSPRPKPRAERSGDLRTATRAACAPLAATAPAGLGLSAARAGARHRARDHPAGNGDDRGQHGQVERHHRSAANVSGVFLDIDHFQSINTGAAEQKPQRDVQNSLPMPYLDHCDGDTIHRGTRTEILDNLPSLGSTVPVLDEHRDRQRPEAGGACQQPAARARPRRRGVRGRETSPCRTRSTSARS